MKLAATLVVALLGSATLIAASNHAPAADAKAAAGTAAAVGDQVEDEWGGLPAGPGREEVFYLCQACHSLAIVKQQGLNRVDWDETLDWMVEEQGMPEPEPDEREALLDYLAAQYGRD